MSDTDKTQKVRKPRHRDVSASRALSQLLIGEVRPIESRTLETETKDNTVIVRGCPIVYDTFYEVRDQFGVYQEKMQAGVCDDVLGDDVVLLYDHAQSIPYARTSAGTMDLESRSDGLYFEARLDGRTQRVQELASAIERGDCKHMSATFRVGKNDQSWNSEMTQRTISRLTKLADISAVTFPASPSTSIEIAQRMLLQASPEATARLIQFGEEMRSGKVLSASNQQKLIDALSAMHSVLGTSGFDVRTMFASDDDDIGDVSNTMTTGSIDPDSVEKLNDGADGDGHDSRSSMDLYWAQLELIKLRRPRV